VRDRRAAHRRIDSVTISINRSVGAAALIAAIAVSACSSSGATTAPAESVAAPSTGASTPPDGMAGPEAPSADVTLQGAGATFPTPLYETWFQSYTDLHPNILFDYQSIGSGGGIKAITEQTVAFGASDAPMKDEEISALPSGTTILHIPTALGAVVVIYNLPDTPKLQLDSANIAGIFLGTITNWNDPTIAANNPDITLPDLPILVVHRSDGSGTTNAFTTYLDTVDSTWSSDVGAGKEVPWPTGIGASGNDGVATGVKQNPGAIGYVELNYAAATGQDSAYVKNADGNFVPGSTAGVTAAAEAAAADFPADFRQPPIINGAGPDTYPIASYTYLLVYQEQADATIGQALVSFIYWALTDGQSQEDALGYAPLPAPVAERSIDELHRITAGGSPIWP
jgi:phosphate transport system substrate-binding protein